jgi:sialidase-1
MKSAVAASAIVILSLILSGPTAAAEPLLVQTDLFEAGKDGYALYRIPGIVCTAKGTLLAYCEARKSNRGDWGTIDIMLRRSTDGGRTWSPRQKIADVPGPKSKNPVALAQRLATDGEVTYNNPVAIVDHQSSVGGKSVVHFLFCLEYMRCFCMRSEDDGQSFSTPVEITATFDQFRSDYDWKVLATGPNHGIQLRTGRLVVPVWISPGTGGHAHRPSVTSVIYSDDHGQSWLRGQIAVPDTPEWIIPNETVVAELADGRVMLNVRSESKAHRRIITTSPNGATNWSTPKFDDALLEPICMASLVRVSTASSGGRNRLLFANPDNLSRADGKEEAGKNRDRRNLTLKLSYDEGQTWPVRRVLEPGRAGYSDLAVGPDGTIFCLYESGTTDGDMYRTGYLRLARLNLEWLTDGKDSISP